MADEKKSQPARDEELKRTLAEFQRLTDPAKRREFYHAHPVLWQIFSPVNFH